MKLSDKIYTCRTHAHMSQEELAERLGVSRQAVSRWECGDNVPEPGKLLMLARVFGVTTDWLLDDEAEPTVEEPKEEAKQPWVDSLVENCKSLAHRFDRMLDECVPANGMQAEEAPQTSDPEPEPEPESRAAQSEGEPQEKPRRTLTQTFRQLLNRFGWKLGVYMALIGMVIAVLSSLAQQVLAVIGGLMTAGGVILTVILLLKARENRQK